MYQFRSLIANLEKELKKLDIDESIELRISNIPNFDFQINNLVKFQNLDDKGVIKKAFSKIIEADPYIKNFEFTESFKRVYARFLELQNVSNGMYTSF